MFYIYFLINKYKYISIINKYKLIYRGFAFSCWWNSVFHMSSLENTFPTLFI